MLAASGAEINAIYARPRTAHLQVGCLRHDESLPAYLATDHLLGKNFAVLGSSGSGKSCAVTVILRSLLDRPPSPMSWCLIRTTSMRPRLETVRCGSTRATSSCPIGC